MAQGPKPGISVIMGVYNSAATLLKSIESIRNQTYQDWELIICDDGSTDGTRDTIAYFARLDLRISVLFNVGNMGLAHTLNRCLGQARGDIIARQDGDDISLPTRLARQAAVLAAHPEYALVGTWANYFDDGGVWGMVRTPLEPQPLDLVRGSVFVHPTCMIRRQVLLDLGGYTELNWAWRVEDYELWFRLHARGYRGGNLPEPLLLYREDRSSYAKRKYRYRINEFRVRWRGYRLLRVPIRSYVYAFKPLLVGLLPHAVYHWLRMHARGVKQRV